MRNIQYAMRVPTVLLCCGMLLLGSCLPKNDRPSEIWEFIPPSASICLKIHDAERFRSDFRNNALLNTYRKDVRDTLLFAALEEVLPLELRDGSLLVLPSRDGQVEGLLPWLLISAEDIAAPVDSLATPSEMEEPLPPILPDSSALHTAIVRGVRLIAPSQALITSASQPDKPQNQALLKALRTANPRASATLFLPSTVQSPLSAFLTGTSEMGQATEGDSWSAFDLEMRSDALFFQGMRVQPDSIWQYARLLRGVPAFPLQENLKVVPPDATALFSFSLQEPDTFLFNQQRYLARENPYPNLVQAVEHLSLLEVEGAAITVLGSVNPEVFDALLGPYRSAQPPFLGTPVFKLDKNQVLQQAFEPLLNTIPDASWYAQLQQYFIFSDSLEALQNLISAFTREATFATSERFAALSPYLASESSALAIALDPEQSTYLTDSLAVLGLAQEVAARLPESYLYTGQLNSSEGFDLLEYQFRKKEDPSGSGQSVSTLFTRKLEGAVQSGPFFLKNHRNGRMDIAVQDDQNQLYLFSDTGSLYWKQTLDGPVQGRISQVDLFKNSRLQMAFTTPETLYVIDRDGNAVAPFPKSLPGGNLGPLAVFDYDKTLNYRLVFSQGSKVYMFDGQGRDVRGFKFRDAGSPILGAPNHIRIGTRDYLVFRLQDGRLRILNRVGDIRVGVGDRFEFSGNGVFLYRNGFVFTEKNGNLVTIDPRGKVARTGLNLNPDHGMYATAKTLSLMNDNVFRVKDNRAELDLGVYTAPRMFYLYDIIYIAVTDIQSQQLYLFRSNAKQVSGFPVEGNSLPDMADTDGDRNPELTVRFRDSAIALYRIQR